MTESHPEVSDAILLILSLGFILLFVMQVVAQPLPCAVDGRVQYETGSYCGDGECTCNITNASNEQIGIAATNATGWYNDTVNVYAYTDTVYVNCTGTGYSGTNSGPCTGGVIELNVTLIVPEFPDIEDKKFTFPGFLIPAFASALLCVAFIGGKGNL
jgi:hypothetical protein